MKAFDRRRNRNRLQSHQNARNLHIFFFRVFRRAGARAMARILFVVAVCYCAICAQVAAVKETTLRQNNNNDIDDTPSAWRVNLPYKIGTNAIHDDVLPIDDVAQPNVPKPLRGRTRTSDSYNYIAQPASMSRSRTKRHAGGHGHASNDDTDDRQFGAPFVKKLFEKFGNGDAETMDVIGFEKMLKHLGLYRFVEDETKTVNQQHDATENTNQTVSLDDVQSVRVSCEGLLL